MESYHIYPCSSNPNIGHLIIEMIVSELVTTKDGVQMWSGNAPEQLEALVEEYYELKE